MKNGQVLTYGGGFVGVITSGNHETRLGVLHSTKKTATVWLCIHPSI